ncbi:SubName: Full=Uncharacterized protein {ECO:0000313/EMBL:CCA76477.1} [Serendipita indica DSM 11827]|nr:SubName: Full=Uncharacterized protein {ECO:0000313/EMBL:CCA76477.1} [Serendipita indica DSM 11827]
MSAREDLQYLETWIHRFAHTEYRYVDFTILDNLYVIYIQHTRCNFEAIIEKLRLQLQRCGPVLPLTILWVTIATEHHISRLFWLFIENDVPFDRRKTLTVKAQGVFPSPMLAEGRLGEFTSLKALGIPDTHPHLFFHHLEKTRDFADLKEVDIAEETLPHEELTRALPRVMGAVKNLTLKVPSRFSSGLRPNVTALKCGTLLNHCPLPHLKELSVKVCSVHLNPSYIPRLTHLEIYFSLSRQVDTVLKFPALTFLILECGKNDLQPLTWLSTPNITILKLTRLTLSESFSRPDAPPITRLSFLTYPRVADLQIEIPLDTGELRALLPHSPATRDMIIPFNVSALEGLDIVLFDLLADYSPI